MSTDSVPPAHRENRSPRELTDVETADVALRLASMTARGAPLAAGVTALADDWPERRVASRLREMGRRLEAGQPLAGAVSALQSPALERVLVAAAEKGRFLGMLQEVLRQESLAVHVRRELWRICGYPALLLAVFAVWVYAAVLVLGGLCEQLAGEFALTYYPVAMTLSDLSALGPGYLAAVMLAPLVIAANLRLVFGRRYSHWIIESLPLLGPVLRWQALIAWGSLLQRLLEAAEPLDKALDLLASSAADPALAQASRRLSAATRGGQSLATAIKSEFAFPATLAPLLAAGEQTHSLSQALATAVALWRERLNSQLRLARGVVPIVTLLFIAVTVCWVSTSVAVPLFNWLRVLSYWDFSGSPIRRTASSRMLIEVTASMLICGIGLLLIVRLLRVGRRPLPWAQTALRIVGLTMVAEAALLAWLAMGVNNRGLGSNVLQSLALIFVCWVAIYWRSAQRLENRWAMFSLLRTALANGLPLPPLLAAFAREQAGPFGRRVNKLLARLERGVPLEEALTKSRGLLPSIAPAGLLFMPGAAGESVDGAPAFLGPAIESRRKLQAVGSRLFAYALYLYLVLTPLERLAPSFHRIFKDFGMPTRNFFGWSVSYAPGGSSTLVFAAISSLLALFVLAIVHSGVAGHDWLKLPGHGWAVRRFDRCMVLRTVAAATFEKRPLAEALAAAKGGFVNGGIRRRLNRVTQDLTAGMHWTASLARWKIISPREQSLLAATQRSGDLTAALLSLASANERRACDRATTIVELLVTLMIMLGGLVLGTFAYECFLPLTELIIRLC